MTRVCGNEVENFLNQKVAFVGWAENKYSDMMDINTSETVYFVEKDSISLGDVKNMVHVLTRVLLVMIQKEKWDGEMIDGKLWGMCSSSCVMLWLANYSLVWQLV